MRHLSAACAVLALFVAGSAFAQTPTSARPFTYQDLIGLNRLSDPQVSPDGKAVVYAVRATDMEANRGVTSLWIKDLEADGEPRRLAISDEGANSARWGSDGGLYFLSGRSGSSQLWRTDPAGRTATQVTRLPLDVNAYRLSPAADRVAVSLAVYPDCPDLACTVERAKAGSERKSTGMTYDRMFVRHWDTWADGTQNHLLAASRSG